MVDLYDETLEEIKQERNFLIFKKLLKVLLIALVVALVFAVIYLIVSNIQKNRIESSASAYYQIQQSAKDGGSVSDKLKVLADDANNYGGFASLELANMARNSGDFATASKLYKEARDNKKYNAVVRDLAFLQYVILQLNGEVEESLLGDIDSALKKNFVFSYALKEAKAYILLKLKREDEAKALIQSITNDQDAPQGIVERSRSIISIL